MPFACERCGALYPTHGTPFRCPACGGLYDQIAAPSFNPHQVDVRQPGLWRYRAALDLPDGAPRVWLGEGQTPLVWLNENGLEVGLKLENLNPTGSYKDRGSAVLLSQLLGRGVSEAVEDSSGNAGASFAAYAACAGVKARVYVPASASGPKLRQIQAYGAEVRAIAGPRSAAAAAVLQEAEAGVPYASHAYLPFGLAGIATIAYELWEAGFRSGSIVAPVGHGGLLLGVLRGFVALQQAGLVDRLPHFVAVQAAACAPLVEAAQTGAPIVEAAEGQTVAEGVRVRLPMRGAAILRQAPAGQHDYLAVAEEEILPACQALARRGFYVEPTSALVWAAWEQLRGKIPLPVVLILTGSGLKYAG